MKISRFISKVILFISIPAMVYGMILVFFSYHLSDILKNYLLPDKTIILITGDSHTELAINDSIYPNAINLSRSGEAYIYTYIKLKSLFEQKTNIKRVIVAYGYHNLSDYYNDFIFKTSSLPIVKDYFFIATHKEQYDLLINNPMLLLRSSGALIKGGLHNSFSSQIDYSFLGSYKKNHNLLQNNKSIDKRIETQFYKKDHTSDFSKLQIKYLRKIVELCKKKNIELYLLNTPMHPYYQKKVPEKFKHRYYQLAKELKTPIIVLDFEKKYNNFYFLPDGDHLSPEGAIIYTRHFMNHFSNISE